MKKLTRENLISVCEDSYKNCVGVFCLTNFKSKDVFLITEDKKDKIGDDYCSCLISLREGDSKEDFIESVRKYVYPFDNIRVHDKIHIAIYDCFEFDGIVEDVSDSTISVRILDEESICMCYGDGSHSMKTGEIYSFESYEVAEVKVI
ncbi:hypothetical protein ACV3UL_16390 [Clostridium perfringens]